MLVGRGCSRSWTMQHSRIVEPLPQGHGLSRAGTRQQSTTGFAPPCTPLFDWAARDPQGKLTPVPDGELAVMLYNGAKP